MTKLNKIKYETVFALWVILPGAIFGLIENVITILTLGFWWPKIGCLEWMSFALDHFPKWASEGEEEW